MDAIRSINLIKVFESITNVKKKGNRIWCCCPVHNEKTPSCLINERLFHCFGCGLHGDIYTLYMKLYQLSFQQARRKICEQYNIPYTYENSNTDIYEVLEAACMHYQNNIHMIDNYIKQRSITMYKEFRIGYSNNNSLLPYLINKRYTNMQQAGLIYKSSLDPLRNRIVFPLINTNNKVIGFAGRVLNNDNPKYINGCETEVFHKSKYLYGEHLLTTQPSHAILVEGYMDVISLYQAGFKNVVGIMGTSISEHHMNMLFSYVNTVYVMLDNDDAGIRAVKNNLLTLVKYITHEKEVYICNLVNYKDADEAVHKDTNIINEVLNSSIHIIQWALNIIQTQGVKSEIARLKQLKYICSHIQDNETRSIYYKYYSNSDATKIIQQPKISNIETQALSLLIQNPELITQFSDILLEATFENEVYDNIRSIIAFGLLHHQSVSEIMLHLQSTYNLEMRLLRQNIENKHLPLKFISGYVNSLFSMISKNKV